MRLALSQSDNCPPAIATMYIHMYGKADSNPFYRIFHLMYIVFADIKILHFIIKSGNIAKWYHSWYYLAILPDLIIK